jgi:hypothetical protein
MDIRRSAGNIQAKDARTSLFSSPFAALIAPGPVFAIASI